MLRALKAFNLQESILHLETASAIMAVTNGPFITGANVFVTLHNAPTAGPLFAVKIWRMRMRFLSRPERISYFRFKQGHKRADPRPCCAVFLGITSPLHIHASIRCQIEGVIKNGADKLALRDQHGIEKDAFVVLCVGQFIDRKCRWTLLEAATSVADARFLWLTPNMPDDDDLARIGKYDLGDRFRPFSPDAVGPKAERTYLHSFVSPMFLPCQVLLRGCR